MQPKDDRPSPTQPHAVPVGRAVAASSGSVAPATPVGDAALADALLALFDRVDAMVGIKEAPSGAYRYANEKLAALFGRGPSAMTGVVDADLMEPAQAAACRVADQAALAQSVPTVAEFRVDRDGVRREFRVHRIGLPADASAPSRRVLSVWLEVTEQQHQEQQLRQALTQLEQHLLVADEHRRQGQDPVARDRATGLYQRLNFDDQLRREVDLSSREHREFALVSIALDSLSAAVLAHGSEARMRVLEALGRLLRGNTRAMDASCRLDEDRFAVLLSGVGLATAHARMEGLRRQCAAHIVVLDGCDLGFTVSMGVASFPHTAHTEEELLAAADLALQEALRRGGNHVALASISFESRR
jgi:diguanylate cyclase (GGDEF)-like protein